MATVKPVENWRKVLRHAWSVRLIAVAVVLSGVEVGIQVMAAYEVPPPVRPGLFAALSGLVTVAAGIARFAAQRKVSGS